MNLFANIKNFAADESGAVTVDWVVLTAAIVGLGIAVIASVRTGTTDLATDIQTSLTGATVDALGTLGSVD
jgi:Flp pilus assembly pilin Flp